MHVILPHEETVLTRRQMEVLELIGKGYTNQQIAQQLFISLNTAKNHVHNVLEKLQVSSRLAAAIWLKERERALRTIYHYDLGAFTGLAELSEGRRTG